MKCIDIDMPIQFSGSCWWNAILTSLFFSDNMKSFLQKHESSWTVQNKNTDFAHNSLRLLYDIFKKLLNHSSSLNKHDFHKMKPENILRLMNLVNDEYFHFNPIIQSGYRAYNYLGITLKLLNVQNIAIYINTPTLEQNLIFNTGNNIPDILIIHDKNLGEIQNTIDFKNNSYSIDSCVLMNHDISSAIGHEIAGIHCNGKQYVYNGWIINNNQSCKLFEMNWINNSNDFCINKKQCGIHHNSTNPLCFNFSKGEKTLIYIKNNINNLSIANFTNIKQSHPFNNKTKTCIRQLSNWSQLSYSDHFDHKSFNTQNFLYKMKIASPKLTSLMDKIQLLDNQDLNSHGKKFKHFIFSDLNRGYGIKLIASTLKTLGMEHILDHKLNYIGDNPSQYHNRFALLTKSSLHGNTISVKTKNIIKNTFNTNKARIIVLDSGFKEGVDLFDVKYAHILEPQISNADKNQVVGRATRMCGQKGLTFIPNIGWTLHVFTYDISIPNQHNYPYNTLFEMYYENAGLDLRKLNLANEINQIILEIAIDYNLTLNIHNPQSSYSQSGGNNLITLNKFDCNSCGKKPKKEYPLNALSIIFALLTFDKNENFITKPSDTKRDHLCKLVKSNPIICNRTGNLYANPVKFIEKYIGILRHNISIYKSIIPKKTLSSCTNIINRVIQHNSYTHHNSKYSSKSTYPIKKNSPLLLKNSPSKSISSPLTHSLKTPINSPLLLKNSPHNSSTKSNYLEKQNYVNTHFHPLKWPPIKIQNECNKTSSSTSKSKYTIATPHPTQQFVSEYFHPNSKEKGMLLCHGTGVGKTGSAVLVASKSFEPHDYTILWVTKSSLKSDIWKNVFETSFHQSISQRIRNNLPIPDSHTERTKLLSKSWQIQPISYKQFSNMLQQKNDIYTKITKINGTEDPLRKTLLIIDEAHKLYGETPDMTTIEKPDVNVLKKAIHNSFEKSGNNSVKLLFMTATPFTNDPMEFIKLLNLMRPQNSQLPDNFEDFSNLYLDEYGRFDIAAKEIFMDHIYQTHECGVISYLNRSKDVRQFAKPEFHDILVPMSLSSNEIPSDKLKQIVRKNISILKNEIKDINSEISQSKKLKPKPNNLQKIIDFKKFEIEQIQSQINIMKNKLDNSKDLKNDLSQETNINIKCLGM